MHTNHHRFADPYIVETWIKGWSQARDVPPPIKESDRFRVTVGWPQQVVRYVFPRLTDSFQQLATTISAPWHFLKVCASPEAVRSVLPSCWVIQPVGFMMTCGELMAIPKTHLPNGYVLECAEGLPVTVVKVLLEDRTIAAIGRIVFVNDFAIYDRIETHPDHRRRGLGSIIMKTLESISIARGVTQGVLVATADGKALYTALGWQLHTLYTTAVIPG